MFFVCDFVLGVFGLFWGWDWFYVRGGREARFYFGLFDLKKLKGGVGSVSF